MDCIFCKIIAKEIPSHLVYEDDFVVAFLDKFPCAKGHTVVIPKQHFASLWEMNSEDSTRMGAALWTVAGRVQTKLKPDGMNIGLNNGKAAGQAVPHLHWHILPRYEGDGGGSIHSIVKNPGETEVKELAKLFSTP